MLPERPARDHYDDVAIVEPHFAPTPSLTLIPQGHGYNYTLSTSIVVKIRHLIEAVYRKHGLTVCPRHGLYWAGSSAFNLDKDNDRTMVLVVELQSSELEKWRQIEGDIREIMRNEELSGQAGICLRFYKNNEEARVYMLGEEESTSSESSGSRPVRGQGSGFWSEVLMGLRPGPRPSSTLTSHDIASAVAAASNPQEDALRPAGASYFDTAASTSREDASQLSQPTAGASQLLDSGASQPAAGASQLDAAASTPQEGASQPAAGASQPNAGAARATRSEPSSPQNPRADMRDPRRLTGPPLRLRIVRSPGSPPEETSFLRQILRSIDEQ